MSTVLRYSVYTLRHPITGEGRYIGLSSQPLVKRLSGHINGDTVGSKSWVIELREKGLEPVIKSHFRNLSYEDAARVEKQCQLNPETVGVKKDRLLNPRFGRKLKE